MVADKIDAELVVQMRDEGKIWLGMEEAHPKVKSPTGKQAKPSVGSIRRVFVGARPLE